MKGVLQLLLLSTACCIRTWGLEITETNSSNSSNSSGSNILVNNSKGDGSNSTTTSSNSNSSDTDTNSGDTNNSSTSISNSNVTVDSVFGLLEGDKLCRCIMDPANLPPMDPKDLNGTDIGDKLGATLIQDLQNNRSMYGIGCGRHDLGTPQCSNTLSSCDNVNTVPAPVNCDLSWCNRSWCFVDPVDCLLLNRRSLNFPHSDRFYSYATCGYADAFTANNRIASLSGKKIKMALNSNTGGWLGAYSSDGVSFKGPVNKWSGPYVDFISEAALRGGFILELTEPPPELNPVANEFFSSKSKFDYCIYVAALGFVDMCIAQYTITNQRASTTDWLLLGSTGIFLIVSRDSEGGKQGWKFFIESVTTIFLPFTPGSWMFIIFFAIPVLGCLMIVHETGKAGSTYPNEEVVIVKDKASGESKIVKRKVHLYTKVVKSIYINLLAILQQSYEQSVTTLGAKLNLLGISFFILTICAAYTANLAALLTGQIREGSIKSLDDAVRAGYRLCSERKNMESILSLYPRIDSSLFVVDPEDLGGDGRPGFNCPNCSARTRVFTHLDPAKATAGDLSYCHAALAPEEDLDVRHSKSMDCNLHTVGQPIQYTQTGIPIFEGLSQELISFFLLLKNEGYYDKQVLASKPSSQCTAVTAQEGDSLSLTQLSGIWVVSFSFAVAGLIATAIQSYYNKHYAKVIIQRVTKFDQRGGKIDALENEEEKIESLKARGSLGNRARGSGRFGFFRSFRVSKKHDSLALEVDDSPGSRQRRVLNKRRLSKQARDEAQDNESPINSRLGIPILDDDKPNQKLILGRDNNNNTFAQNGHSQTEVDGRAPLRRMFAEGFKGSDDDDDDQDDDMLFDIQEDQEPDDSSCHYSTSSPTRRTVVAANVESHPNGVLDNLDVEQPPKTL